MMNGSELKVIRDLSGVPIVEFARLLGVGKTTVQRYERGDNPIPPGFARRVSDTFGVTPELALEIREVARRLDEIRGRLRIAN